MEPDQVVGAERVDSHRSAADFTDYYTSRHESPDMLARFAALKGKLLAFYLSKSGGQPRTVLDVGCGPGAQAMLWAADGYRVSALDINADLIDAGRSCAARRGVSVDFQLGSATNLPWPDRSFDLVIAPELLEHVVEWSRVLDELVRVLRPGGTVFLSTTNKLCPRQEEFLLPLYSWYPAFLKRHYERLAVTTRPELVKYATYPAVNWFTPYSLGRALLARGVVSYDRFDVLDVGIVSPAKRVAGKACRALRPLRFLGHCMTQSTTLFGVRQGT